jgi:ribonuclease E
VIDFIDMEYNSNVRKVEKAMKEALKNDRARIQVGRISGFGLMEMSRQRLRTGVLEATTRSCPHCDGTGLVRTASSAGLSALRLIEDEAAKGKGTVIKLAASTEAAIYLLNEKRDDLVEIEQRYGVRVEVVPEGEDEGAKMSVSSHGPRPAEAPKFEPIIDDEDDDDLPEEDMDDEADEDTGESDRRSRGRDRDDEDDGGRKKKRRRRRGGRGRNRKREDDERDGSDTDGDDEDGSDSDQETHDETEQSDDNGDDKPKKRRRRGGRGRRRGSDENGSSDDTGDESQGDENGQEIVEVPTQSAEEVAEQVKEDMTVVAGPDEAPETAEAMAADEAEPAPAEKPKRKRAPRKKKVEEEAPEAAAVQEDAPSQEAPAPEAAPKAAAPEEGADNAPDGETGTDGAPRKRGWWQRTFGE